MIYLVISVQYILYWMQVNVQSEVSENVQHNIHSIVKRGVLQYKSHNNTIQIAVLNYQMLNKC